MKPEKREAQRALNMIWNAAQDYEINPVVKVFDENGRAELYWNCIIGAVYRHIAFAPLEALLRDFKGDPREYQLQNLLWLGLESSVFPREEAVRPALGALRRAYAQGCLSHAPGADPLLFEKLQRAYYQETLSLPQDPPLTPYQQALFEALHFDPALDGQQLAERARALFAEFLHFSAIEDPPVEEEKPGRTLRLPFALPFGKKKKAGAVKDGVGGFGSGFSDYGGGTHTERDDLDYHLSAFNVISEGELRDFMRNFFGEALYTPAQMHTMESALCTGNHATCHLHFTRGDFSEKQGYKGKDDYLKMSALRQRERNRAYFDAHRTQALENVARLSARIRNSLLVQMQSSLVKSRAGRLNAGRAWRYVHLSDEHIFDRELRGDSGDLSVDILLDGSTSQSARTEKLATQAYIIAESLTRCAIPVRVFSFCSLRGFTIFHLFRDYGENGKNDRVFGYFTAGCNRDGLALRVCHDQLKKSACEHRLLIVLSDVRPNGVQRVRLDNGAYQNYADDLAVRDVAAEVRAAEREGIRVLCVFTGEDDALPAVKLIYGAGFTRIHDLEHFADAVGNMIRDQIKNF